MTNASRITMIRLLVLEVLVLAATSWAQQRSPICEQIAKTYGLDSWGQIEAIRYTFNADFPGVKLSRSWIWEPKTGQVSYEGKDKAGKPVKLTYLRSQLSSQAAVVKDEIDPAFFNDQYWLLFPLHLSWDSSAEVEETGRHKLPLGKGSASRVVVKYPSEGGYTPGDTWELFVGTDNRIREFVYHRGGSKKPTVVVASWEDYKKAGPLLVSLDHRGTGTGAAADLPFGCVCQAGGVEHLGERAINNGRAHLTANLICLSIADKCGYGSMGWGSVRLAMPVDRPRPRALNVRYGGSTPGKGCARKQRRSEKGHTASVSEENTMEGNAKETNDQPVLGHIERLVAEEHRLYNQGTTTEDDRARLAKIQVELDQCWDLLRQRRALREFGRDPKEAHVRPPEVVEHYEG